jgi:hypothetical protein
MDDLVTVGNGQGQTPEAVPAHLGFDVGIKGRHVQISQGWMGGGAQWKQQDDEREQDYSPNRRIAQPFAHRLTIPAGSG